MLSRKFTIGYVAAVSIAAAQVPYTGDIEFYGLHKVPVEKVRKALGVKTGDPLPPSKGDLEERLEQISDVVLARVEAVCCSGASAVLFVGIEEKGAPHFALRSAPQGPMLLPDSIIGAYRDFLRAVESAARRGSVNED